MVAVDPRRERRVTLVAHQIVSGRYLPDEPPRKGHLPLILGRDLARKLAVQPGSEVGLDVMTPDGYPIDAMFQVVGIFRTGVEELDRTMVFVPIQVAWNREYLGLRTPDGQHPGLHELAIRIRRGESEKEVAGRLREALGPRVLVRTWREVDPNTAQILKATDTSMAVFLAIVFLIAMLGTMNTMLMAVHERTREFGVLKSIGFGPGLVFCLILLETAAMTAVASVLGAALGTALDWYLVRYGLDLRSVNPSGFTYQGLVLDPIWRAILVGKVVVLPTVLLAVASLVSAIWPAGRAARIRPVQALAHER